jgi:hypothetical protein
VLIAVTIALLLWAAGTVYGINLGRERTRTMNTRERWFVAFTTIFLIPAFVMWIAVLVFRSLRLEPEGEFPWSARMAQRLETGFLFAFGLFCWSIGLILMLAVLPADEVFALIFGFGFVIAALVALFRHRHHRQWLIDHRRHGLALFYLPAVPMLLTAGCLILAYGL